MALYMLKHGRQTVFNKNDTKAVASHCIQTLVLTADSKFINDLHLSSTVMKYKL